MPNYQEHLDTSGLVGGMLAGAMAWTSPGAGLFQVTCEAIGGRSAARLSGILPDVFEPAYCPNHRNVCHAVFPVGAALVCYSGYIPQLQDACRQQARLAEASFAVAATPLEAFGQLCTACLWYMAAGAVVGAPVGYAVHVLQDGATPMGVKLIGWGI